MTYVPLDKRKAKAAPRLFISAAHKSSGKTIVSLGLSAAFRSLGLAVQPYKKGPDFIDPLWLTAATGRACRNLDFNTMSRDEILACFTAHAAGADLAIVEANKGCYDGVATDGHDSAAALAHLLAAPVLLVIDTEGMTRGIAPLLLGYRQFDPDLAIAGVILNKVSGPRHEAKLRRAVETYTDIPVLGALHRSPDLAIQERHLGLVPANEAAEANAVIARIAASLGERLDLSRLMAIARTARPLPVFPRSTAAAWSGPRRRIGLASDAAFGFYYQDDLDGLAEAGCDPVPFNTLTDRRLPPDLDGLFLGGGFPETHMAALEANVELRTQIHAAVVGGLPVYAECGGMMYLCRAISWKGESRAMVGALDADAVMHARPQGKGHVLLEETENAPWPGRTGWPDSGPRVPLCQHRKSRRRHPFRLQGAARPRDHRRRRRHRHRPHPGFVQPSARRRPPPLASAVRRVRPWRGGGASRDRPWKPKRLPTQSMRLLAASAPFSLFHRSARGGA